ncbi:MAG: hypothetical protein ABR562_09450, partial [Thermoplasmatota archaeon]
DVRRAAEAPYISVVPELGEIPAMVHDAHLRQLDAEAGTAGDQRASHLLALLHAMAERHDELARREIESFRGRVVKTLGDGILATFDGPARAIRCAESMRDRAASELGLEIVVDVHDEESLAASLERIEPEIFLLSPREADEDEDEIERILDLLPDVPAGKLAIADLQAAPLIGEAHVCEIFLENVEVPADQLIGEAGMGWTYAKFLLEHERTTSSFIYWSKR